MGRARQPASVTPVETLPERKGSKGHGNVSATALPQAKEVVVIGIGTDTEKALQNAFSQAIEQTVGVLVDAETVVKNDQLIRDEVLTYSQGYVEKYDIVKRWEEGGLRHVEVQATVARSKLAEKLKSMKFAVKEVTGDLAAHQFEFDATNEAQATQILSKAMADFDMIKLTKLEIVGKPEITREGERPSACYDQSRAGHGRLARVLTADPYHSNENGNPPGRPDRKPRTVHRSRASQTAA